MTLVPSAVAAVALGVKPCTVRQMIRRGKLTRYGTDKRTLVDLGECERAMLSSMPTPTPLEDMARAAFTAYLRKTGFGAFPDDDDQMPQFDDLPESRARIAYVAYGRKTGFKNFQGGEMPLFEDLPETIREAWIAASGVIWDLATTGKATI